MKIFAVIRRVISIIKKYYDLSKYDPYTIAEYFRRQGARIGNDCFISVRSLGGEPFLVSLGNHVAIANGVQFLTHNLGWIFRDRIPDLQLFGKIVIEDNCNIGVNAILMANVTVGKNSIVGAGSIVNKDIPPNSIAVGVPAKVVGNTDEYFDKAREIWKEQRPPDYIPELQVGKYYSPAYFDLLRGRPENRALLRKHLTQLFWHEER
jgi:acetyltransferase-like isoleucine patch superfamily enzyme